MDGMETAVMADNPFLVVRVHKNTSTIAQTGITTSPHGYANFSGQIRTQKLSIKAKKTKKSCSNMKI
jgi:hypothetical protein